MTGTVKSRDQRTIIINESIKLFLCKGYHATSMDDISLSVGLEKSSIYRYFKGKEAILRQCVLIPLQDSVTLIEEIVVRESSPLEQLHHIIHIQTWIIRNHPEIFITVQENFDLFDVELRNEVVQLQTQYAELFRTIILRGIESGLFRADLSPGLVSHAIFGMCNWMLGWHRRNAILTSFQITNQFLSFLTNGIRGDRKYTSDHIDPDSARMTFQVANERSPRQKRPNRRSTNLVRKDGEVDLRQLTSVGISDH